MTIEEFNNKYKRKYEIKIKNHISLGFKLDLFDLKNRITICECFFIKKPIISNWGIYLKIMKDYINVIDTVITDKNFDKNNIYNKEKF
ncbi:hypothetical protein [Spiroplasma chrysopicola]|uniref:Uncharacterized protein n=1 Tax=Spiroplasma chrysopicola DF-1 TaxID=1276227 RepID=R4UBA5_9MOLU|nr:hypothetical protein [Spiroplasma chrysopicola]AGM25159.1 hypothetical protein SCHRY_v1c05810 [Spiroplasma chrysopicola DF-1]